MNLCGMSIEELERLRRDIDREMNRRRSASGLHPGDPVIHRKGTFPGTGTVVEIAKSGQHAKVRYQDRFGLSSTYYRVDMLVPVNKPTTKEERHG